MPRPKRKEPTLAEEIAASGETETDAARAAEQKDREDHAFLARELLAWLAFHADTDGGRFEGEGDVADFTLQFGGRISLRAPLGAVTDVALKGSAPAATADLRYALAGGLSIKEAELRLDRDDRSYTFALAAEHFDLKRVKLPALLTEEDDDRADERLTLVADVEAALLLAFARFLEVRTSPSWRTKVIPAIRAWLDEGT